MKTMTKRLFVGASILLIAGSAFAIVRFIKQPTVESIHKKVAAAEKRYKCDQCGKDFSRQECTFTPLGPQEVNPSLEPELAMRPDCPFCKALHSGHLMTTCMQCGKYYVSPMPDANATPYRDVCPFCKTDQSQWYDEHVRGAGK